MSTNLILAVIMALFGILGYIYGSRSALLTAITVWAGLLVVARLGVSIESLLNVLSKAIRFALNGGLGELSKSGDLQALGQATKGLQGVGPLVNGSQQDKSLLLLVVIAVGLVVLLGRHPQASAVRLRQWGCCWA